MLISLDRLGRLLMSPEGGADAGGSTAVADAAPSTAGPGVDLADPGDDGWGDDSVSDDAAVATDTAATDSQQTTETTTGDTVADDTATGTDQAAGEGATKGAQTEAPRFDDDLLALAEHYGLPREAAMAYPSQQALAATVLSLSQVAPVKQQEGETAPEQYVLPESVQQQIQRMQDEGVSEEIINSHRATHETYGKEIHELRGIVTQLQGVLVGQQQAARESRFDSFLLSQNKPDLFGKGSFREIDQQSAEAQNRVKVYRVFDQLHSRGIPEQQALKGALFSVFGDQLKQFAREEVQQDVNRFNGQRTNKPTQRASRAPTGREAAITKARSAYSTWGMADSGEVDETDSLL